MTSWVEMVCRRWTSSMELFSNCNVRLRTDSNGLAACSLVGVVVVVVGGLVLVCVRKYFGCGWWLVENERRRPGLVPRRSSVFAFRRYDSRKIFDLVLESPNVAGSTVCSWSVARKTSSSSLVLSDVVQRNFGMTGESSRFKWLLDKLVLRWKGTSGNERRLDCFFRRDDWDRWLK